MLDSPKVAPLTLILFTSSYPYERAAEQTFLEPEITQLVKNFERVIIVPEQCTGPRCEVLAGVQIEEEFAQIYQSAGGKKGAVLRSLFSPLFYQELVKRPATLFQPLALKKLVSFIDRTELAKKWVQDFIKRDGFEVNHSIFYTFWLDASSLGVGLTKKSYPGLKLVSRAHGYDLYEWRSPYAYIPCRQLSLKTLDGLFPDSEAGSKYIVDHYPWFAPLCQTARLGVSDPGFITLPSADGAFRIVSCSFVIPLKRVDLLLQGIECAARQRPEQQFIWHHFGTGLLKQGIEETALKTLPPNVKNYFPGYPSTDHLMQFYQNNPVDLFVNTSVTEGTPVAVMEAISCGIPVLATAVGGNQEIVSEDNGKLLSPNPTPQEIAAAIFHFLDNAGVALTKRAGSRRIWQEKYNAESNFQAFADYLKAIRVQPGSQ